MSRSSLHSSSPVMTRERPIRVWSGTGGVETAIIPDLRDTRIGSVRSAPRDALSAVRKSSGAFREIDELRLIAGAVVARIAARPVDDGAVARALRVRGAAEQHAELGHCRRKAQV